jgi:hypothetical protein
MQSWYTYGMPPLLVFSRVGRQKGSNTGPLPGLGENPGCAGRDVQLVQTPSHSARLQEGGFVLG